MKIIFKILIGFLLFFIFLFAGFAIYAHICISKLDKSLIQGSNLLKNFQNQLMFFDNEEKALESTSFEGKTVAKLEELPNYLKYAFISIEDKKFYEHNGINLKRILKSVFDNITSGYAKSGASTISQQLIKNIHLSSQKTLERKIQEAYLTKKLEKNYSKDEILETYLNVIYFGNNTYGIENASKKYFDKSAKDLSLNEAATLAGIIKSPSLYSPIENPQNCLERRNLVLSEMQKDGYILYDEFLLESQKDLGLKLQKNILNNTPYFKNCLKEAEEILSLDETEIATSNYKIYTYLDSQSQQNTINNLKSTTNQLSSFNDFCVVALDNQTCGVSVYISNTTKSILRQPGSLIKPILCYAPAFEEGILSPLTPINDEKIEYHNWQPKNVDGTYEGYISCREALYKSKNIPAIKTLSYVGIEKAKQYAQEMGIIFDESDNHLALALGAMRYGTDIKTLVSCYMCFANNGKYEKAHFIKKITDQNGNIVYELKHTNTHVFSEETCFLINDILKDCAEFGTAKKLNTLNLTLSAKTGTVGDDNGNSDSWCISYNQKMTICSWVGNLTNKKENNLNNSQNGGTIAATLSVKAWENFKTLNNWFNTPSNIEKVNIDKIDYDEKHILNLASINTPQEFILTDYFNKKFLPKTYSNNFDNLIAPILTLKKEGDFLTFLFEQKNIFKYDLYCNNILIVENVNTNYKIDFPTENSCFYILMINKYNLNNKKSNEVIVYNTS